MVRTRTFAVAVWSMLALGACVVAPAGYYAPTGYHDQPEGYGTPLAVTDVPPPAPYYEVRPALPYLGAIWISGYWGWHGGGHHWVPGRWDRPRQGYSWQPHAWQRYDGRWALRGGGWSRGR